MGKSAKSNARPETKSAQFWLFKTEPECYSIDDLERDRSTFWEGVRNYQARNFIRDDMKVGDAVLIHHSSCHPPGIAGLARICVGPYPDETAFDRKSQYYDPKAAPENPIWFRVDVEFVRRFDFLIGMDELRSNPKLAGMMLLAKGSRLSIQPVSKTHFEEVLKMADKIKLKQWKVP